MESNTNKIANLLNQYLNQATLEDQNVLISVLEGLLKKQDGTYSTYIASLIRLNGDYLDNGDFQIEIPNQLLIANSLDIAHGGITATLLDTTMGTMVSRRLSEGYFAVTTEMKVNYMKPGTGETLRCVATLLHQGKQLCFTEGKVFSNKNELIATASGTFFIVRKS